MDEVGVHAARDRLLVFGEALDHRLYCRGHAQVAAIEQALALLRQAISLDRASPYVTRVQYELTEVLKAEGRCEEATTVLQGLIETDLDKDMADDYHLSLADCHERMRQFDRALTLYTQFAEKFENYPNKRWLWQKIRQLREITNQLQGTAGAQPPADPVPPPL